MSMIAAEGRAKPLPGSAGASPRSGSSHKSKPRTGPTHTDVRVTSSEPARESTETRKPGYQNISAPKKSSGGSPSYNNYQQIILAEFVAAELLVALSPIVTPNKKGPTLSPYAPSDVVRFFALGLVYFILETLSAGGGAVSRVYAWFGGLILLGVGLNEAATLSKVFKVFSGGTKAATDATLTSALAEQETAVQQFLSNVPLLSTGSPSGAASLAGTATATGKTGGSLVAEAAKFIGTPYVWGGESPAGFDCSGLVQYALQKLGVSSAPRTSEAQWAWVQRISRAQLQAGDLIFEQWPGEASPGHVAIYAGNGKIIQAPAPGQDVQEVAWSPSIVHKQGGQIVGYGRVPGLAYGGSGGGSATSPNVSPSGRTIV